MKMLAAGLGVEIEELREVHERRPAPEKIDLGFGVIEEGTTAAMRFEVQGIVGGEPRIVLEHVTRLDDDLCPDWPQPVGAGGYRVDRHRHAELPVRRADDGPPGEGDPGVVGTAGRIVNAIPDVVCEPRPGCCRRSTCRWSPAAGSCADMDDCRPVRALPERDQRPAGGSRRSRVAHRSHVRSHRRRGSARAARCSTFGCVVRFTQGFLHAACRSTNVASILAEVIDTLHRRTSRIHVSSTSASTRTTSCTTPTGNRSPS